MMHATDTAHIADRSRALKLTPVSRETAARLDQFVEVLLRWQQRTNLIAPSTIPTLWTRHIADSLQLLDLAPNARAWVDLGSGAGFPGLVLACALAGIPGAQVHLIESNTKKASFLREAARLIGAPAHIHAVRIEDFVQKPNAVPEVVTARALAPLKALFELAYPLLAKGALGLFSKGQDVEIELEQATRYWKFEASLTPSKTSPLGRIVVVRRLKRRNSVDEQQI